VTLALLDHLLELEQAVENLLGPRRAARDVDVDGDDLIDPGDRGVVLVEAARRGADAEGDDPLRLRELIGAWRSVTVPTIIRKSA